MNEALRLATTPGEAIPVDIETTAMLATELRRLYDLHGKANALCRIRAERIKELEALNAELVEALRWCIRQMPEPVLPGEYTEGFKVARAALANSKVNLEGKAK